MKKLSVIIAICTIWGCEPKKTSETDTSETIVTEPTTTIKAPYLTQIWESDTLLTTSESVIYDPFKDVLYVSCINGTPPDIKDGDGFISIISVMDGEIINHKWIEGLNAPKGMVLSNSTLYVTDIDEVVEIDIPSAQITKKTPVKDAQFLNDMTIDDIGNILISDSGTDKIHMLTKKGKMKTWIEDVPIGRPNGLYYDGSRVLLSTSKAGTFNEINYETKEITVLTDSIFGGDGVEMTGADFIVSSWSGEVYYVTAEGVKTKMLDTKADKINSADIEFISGKALVLVPTFFDNRVVAYKLTK